MFRGERTIRIGALAVSLSLIAGAVATVAVGRVTAARLISHSAVVFVPMLGSVLWCLRPNAMGRCATFVRRLAIPKN
jgi:hypothetical protein